MTTTGQIIRWSTAGAVVGVAAVAAVASYEHAYALVRAHGETGWIGRLVPLTVDGLIYASSMVMLDSARREVPVPALARWLLGLGIAATLAANVAHGLGHGPVGAAVAAWPAIALVGSYELFMTIIRGARQPDGGVSGTERVSGAVSGTDPLRVQAAEVFAADVAAGRVPSIRAIRSRLRVGQPRAQQVRAYLLRSVTGRFSHLAFRVCPVSLALAGHASPERGASQGLAGVACPAEVIKVHQRCLIAAALSTGSSWSRTSMSAIAVAPIAIAIAVDAGTTPRLICGNVPRCVRAASSSAVKPNMDAITA